MSGISPINPALVPSPPPPPPVTRVEAGQEASALPAQATPAGRAQDALQTMGLDLSAQYSTDGADLSGLVDEAALPLEGVLRGGADPAAVSALQSTLNALGMEPPLAVDGQYGPLTTAAVRQFQEQVGLKADGLAGPNTKRALQATEAMALAAASKDPAEAEAFRAQAQELISGIQPAEEQATLQGRLDALPKPGPANLASDAAGSGALAEVLPPEAVPVPAEVATPEALAPYTPPEATGELAAREEAGTAPTEAEVAADAHDAAAIAAVDAAAGSEGVAAVIESPLGEAIASGGQAEGLEAVLDDFFVGNGDAHAAGVAAARLVNEDPSRMDAIWSRLQESAGHNNGEAFVEGFLSAVDPQAAKQLPVLCPETFAAMQGEYNFAERLWGDEAASTLDAIAEGAQIDPAGLVGSKTYEELQAVEAASAAGSLGELLTPEWLASASDAAVNRAFQLACQGHTSAEDAAVAGRAAAEMMTRDPATAELVYQQFDAYDTGDQDNFVDALVGSMSEQALGRVATVNPELALTMQEKWNLSEGTAEKVQQAWLQASTEARQAAYEHETEGGIWDGEAAHVAALAASLGNEDPSRLPGLMEQFNRDTGSYGPFMEALWAQANPALRQAIAQSGIAEGYVDAGLLQDALERGPGPF